MRKILGLPMWRGRPFAQASIEQFVLVTQDRQLLPYAVPIMGML